jgi:hypothetical protein
MYLESLAGTDGRGIKSKLEWRRIGRFGAGLFCDSPFRENPQVDLTFKLWSNKYWIKILCSFSADQNHRWATELRDPSKECLLSILMCQ